MAETEVRARTTSEVHPRVVVAIVLPCIAAYGALFAYAMQHTSYDVWGALWLVPVLIALSLPILLRYSKGDPTPHIGTILVFALLLKLAATVPRYYMVAVMYGTGDSLRYSDTATRLRQAFLQADFSLIQLGTDNRTGTQFVEIVNGIIYVITGPSIISGFIFFSWLSFWGLFFFYRAFRVAIADGDSRRYALLLFFLPSMLFWPSSIGKEAWMTLGLGITTYGCALLLQRQRGATVYLVLGLAGVLMVRPHMALLAVAGIALAYTIRSGRAGRVVKLGRTRTVLGIGSISVATLLVTRRVAEFFGVDEFNLDTAVETLEYTEGQTSQGGSEFVGGGPSLRNLPLNLVTVIFRPFAFEVNNIQSLLAALEGMLLMMLFALALPRLKTVPSRMRKQPYITYCVTYIIIFCFMFSAFQNFGILARQRVLVFPLVLVLLALPLASPARRRRPSSDPTGGTPESEPRVDPVDIGTGYRGD